MGLEETTIAADDGAFHVHIGGGQGHLIFAVGINLHGGAGSSRGRATVVHRYHLIHQVNAFKHAVVLLALEVALQQAVFVEIGLAYHHLGFAGGDPKFPFVPKTTAPPAREWHPHLHQTGIVWS